MIKDENERVAITLPKELSEMADNLAKNSKITKSELIRASLILYLNVIANCTSLLMMGKNNQEKKESIDEAKEKS